MKKIPVKSFNSLIDLTKHFPDEKTCRFHLEQMRWNDDIICVHCGSSRKIYRINDSKLYKCADCTKQFTVRVGTIFEDSALPLQKWFMAIYLIMAHKKGISSIQLSKDIGVTQKTAWFMLHRIRYAVRTKSFDKPLTGTVEADETLIGGKEQNKHFDKRTPHAQGRNSEAKTPVFGMKQRGGIVKAQTVDRTDTITLQTIMREQISKMANIVTDEYISYKECDDYFKTHKKVNHSAKEYVRGNVHTNSIESFWAILKRGIFGIYHHVDRKHLDKYIDEFEFRFNSKDISDVDRFNAMLSFSNGRLMYKILIAK